MTQQTIGVGAVANDGTGDALRVAYQKANANFSELYAGVYTRVFDVTQYGAVFDGSTDTSAAIQSAINAARTFISAGTYRSAEIVLPQGQIGVVKTTLNMTGFTDISARVKFNAHGTCLYGATSGAPVIDALGSYNIAWHDLHISGGSPNSPNIGLLIGRINTAALNSGGNGMSFHHCRIVDHFTLSALYNFSAESCTYVDCLFENSIASATAFAAIFDGINHFGVTSAFVTQSAPANTPQSFNENLFLRCNFVVATSTQVAAVWKSGCRQHTHISTYVAVGSGGYAFLEYCVSGIGGVSQGNRYDVHFEGNGVTNIGGYFLLDGTLANPSFGGFELKTSFIFATEVFKTQGSITSVAVNGLLLDMVGEINSTVSGSFKVFDNPALWTINGRANVILTSYWNLSSTQGVTVNGVPYITCDMA